MSVLHTLLAALLVSVAIHLSSGYVTTPSAPISVGTPWPMPQEYSPTTTVRTVSTNLHFDTKSSAATKNCDLLQSAVVRCRQKIVKGSLTQRPPTNVPHNGVLFHHRRQRQLLQAQAPELNMVTVTLDTTCDETTNKLYPSQKMKEDYKLAVGDDEKVLIGATEVWGAIRALETLSQLVYRNIDGTLVMNSTSIKDYPRFSYRGAMLDTSRHFVSKRVILQNLDAMALNKLNVFHWHVVDDNSFPYQSRVFPQLSEKGAFNPISHIYTQDDITDIIEYGRRRGIRVVPEFDTPGHTLSWGAGQPDLLTPCYKNGKKDGTFGPIDPSRNSSFDFVSKFFGEVTSVFKEEYLHLGGDEVPFDCWLSNPDVVAFMKKMGFDKDGAKLESYYIGQLVDIVGKVRPKGKDQKLVVWQEVFDNGVNIPASTIVHIWKGDAKGWQEEMAAVTKKGFPTILSSPWYLNYIHYGIDWQPLYQADPAAFNGTDTQKASVVGGEACIWGEFIDNTNLISNFWPRASTVAERLWSAASVNNVSEATPRLEAMRCRMIKQGYNAEPINNRGGFCSDEYKGNWQPIWA